MVVLEDYWHARLYDAVSGDGRCLGKSLSGHGIASSDLPR